MSSPTPEQDDTTNEAPGPDLDAQTQLSQPDPLLDDDEKGDAGHDVEDDAAE